MTGRSGRYTFGRGGAQPGRAVPRASRFIFNIDKALLQYTDELPDSIVRDAQGRIRSSETELAQGVSGPRFAVGERVLHGIMGAGLITGVDTEKGVYTIQFDALPTPRNISFKAKLEAEGFQA